MPTAAAFTLIETLLLIAAGTFAAGGVLSLLAARATNKSTLAPTLPGLKRLSEPTRAVLGMAFVIGAYHLAAPVLGWSGLRGPMGVILAVAVVSAIGSIWLDRRNPEALDDRHSSASCATKARHSSENGASDGNSERRD